MSYHINSKTFQIFCCLNYQKGISVKVENFDFNLNRNNCNLRNPATNSILKDTGSLSQLRQCIHLRMEYSE